MPMAISDVAPISFWEYGTPWDTDRVFRIAILSEGFLPEEMKDFRRVAANIAARLPTAEPFSRYSDRIAILRIECKSFASARQLAALQPAPASYANQTPFDVRFDRKVERMLAGNNGAVRALMRSMTQLPPINANLVLVNSYLYGGTQQDDAAWVTIKGTAPSTFLHELGHLAFGLGDEYEEMTLPPHPRTRTFHGVEPAAPNVTRARTLQAIKWKAFITEAIALPTTEPSPAGICVMDKPVVTTFPPVSPRAVGLFEGSGTFSCGLYRPQFTCRMREDEDDFCAVCDREISRRLDRAIAAAPAVSVPNEDWTHVVQLAPDIGASGAAFHFAVCYNAATGRFAVFYLGDLSLDDPAQHSSNDAFVDIGFTTVVAFAQGGKHFLMFANALTDQRILYRVRPVLENVNQSVLDEVYRSAEPPRAGFSHAVAYDIDDWTYILHYDRATGAIEIDSMRIEQDFVGVDVAGSSRAGSLSAWHAGLSNIAVLTIAGQPYLVGVDASGGRLYVAAIGHPVGDVPIAVLNDTWSARPEFAQGFQSHVAGVTLRNGRSRLLMYSTLSGRMQMFRPRRGGKGIDFELSAQLAPGAPSMFDAGFPAMGVFPSAIQVGASAPNDVLWLYNFGLKRFQALKIK